MSRLFNVNLQTGECIEERVVDAYDSPSVEEMIVRLRAAAEGLTDPTVSAQRGDYDGDEPEITVSGRRRLTTAEVAARVAEAERERRYLDYLKRFPG